MILDNINYEDIQKMQDTFFYNILLFSKIPIKKRIGITPYILSNCVSYTETINIKNLNFVKVENISEYINKLIFLNINEDKIIINQRSIYNTKLNRTYHILHSDYNSITFMSQPENKLLLDETNKYRDELLVSYDYQFQWEYVSPALETVFIPQRINYVKQKLTPVYNKNVTFNKLNITIDYDRDYITTPQNLIDNSEQMLLNILVKKPYLFELYEINISDIITPVMENFIDIEYTKLDQINYRYILKSLLEFCFKNIPNKIIPNIKKTQSKQIFNSEKIITLTDYKLNITIEVTQNNNLNKKSNTLANISDGYTLMFLNNYKYYTSNIPASCIYNDKVIQEINGATI